MPNSVTTNPVPQHKGAFVFYSYTDSPHYKSQGYVSFCQAPAIDEEGPDSFGVPDDMILFYTSAEELNTAFTNKEPLNNEINIFEYTLVPV